MCIFVNCSSGNAFAIKKYKKIKQSKTTNKDSTVLFCSLVDVAVHNLYTQTILELFNLIFNMFRGRKKVRDTFLLFIQLYFVQQVSLNFCVYKHGICSETLNSEIYSQWTSDSTQFLNVDLICSR